MIAGIIGKNERDRLSQIYQEYFSDEKLLSTINTVMDNLGDGLVTVESATLEGMPIETVNGNHLTIIRNIISDDERMPPAIPLIIEQLK